MVPQRESHGRKHKIQLMSIRWRESLRQGGEKKEEMSIFHSKLVGKYLSDTLTF